MTLAVGEYKPDEVVNMLKAVVDKASISKGGVFGTTADRWSSVRRQQVTASQLPGPGDYEPPVAAGAGGSGGTAGVVVAKKPGDSVSVG
jgi:hypothetical protein